MVLDEIDCSVGECLHIRYLVTVHECSLLISTYEAIVRVVEAGTLNVRACKQQLKLGHGIEAISDLC